MWTPYPHQMSSSLSAAGLAGLWLPWRAVPAALPAPMSPRSVAPVDAEAVTIASSQDHSDFGPSSAQVTVSNSGATWAHAIGLIDLVDGPQFQLGTTGHTGGPCWQRGSLLPLAGRAGQFHATRVDSQCFGGALPPFCASAAWQRSCCVCSPDPRCPAGWLTDEAAPDCGLAASASCCQRCRRGRPRLTSLRGWLRGPAWTWHGWGTPSSSRQ